MSMTSAYTRRGLLGLFAVVSGAALAGCDRKPAAAVGVSGAAGPSSPVKGKVGVPILVYRDPECGCCEAWADIARAEGYAVTVENRADMAAVKTRYGVPDQLRSEEHTSELQSLMRISYAVFCLKKKNKISTLNQFTSTPHELNHISSHISIHLHTYQTK